ncbi:MAG: hypothetical protein EAZ91_05490 [Cytophagales bacterium]|nr:MAG: hypothetical protein EAZ91_05490 [Cytophagales bacterium]
MRPLLISYYLSLPVVLGAILSNRMAARLSGVEPVNGATWPVLGLVVWLIYTVDRLLDVRKPGGAQTLRHQFHQLNKTGLWQSVGGITLLAGVLTFFLPKAVWQFGLVLAAVCGGYVFAVFRLPAKHPALLLKEPLVALLFSAGIWGSVWAQRPTISGVEWTEGLMFTAIAFQNLLLFALFEQAENPGKPTFSLATAWGSRTCDQILRWLTFGVVAAAFGICLMANDESVGGGLRFAQRSALMLAIMSMVLYAIQRYPTYYLKRERYRWIGDAVFWLPALVL